MKNLFCFGLLIFSTSLYSNAAFSDQRSGDPQYSTQADLDGKEYFIKDNAVYWRFINQQISYKIPNSDGMIDSLVAYQDHIYALEGTKRGWLAGLIKGSGTVYEFVDNKWAPVDYNDKQVLATKHDLVTLSKTGELWIYNGSISPVQHESSTTYVSAGNNVMIPVTSQYDVHPTSFHSTNLSNVKSITVGKNPDGQEDIIVSLANGSSMTLSELKAANFSADAVRELRALVAANNKDQPGVFSGQKDMGLSGSVAIGHKSDEQVNTIGQPNATATLQ